MRKTPKNTIERLTDLFNSFKIVINGTEQIGTASDFQIYTDEIAYLREGRTYQIQGKQYYVNVITPTYISFTCVGHTDLLPNKFELDSPFFFHGTITQTNKELADITDFQERTPLFYLYEIIEENWFIDKSNDLETTLRLYLLDSKEYGQTHTKTIYNDRLNSLYKVIHDFVEWLPKKGKQGVIEEYSTTPLTNFATIKEYGYDKQLFSEDLCGIELTLKIKFKKEVNCVCN